MTRAEWLAEIDRLVAVHVMGWTGDAAAEAWWDGKGYRPVEEWQPTRRWDQAGRVFEKCRDMVLRQEIYPLQRERALYSAGDELGLTYMASADTAPLAICLAALRKHGVNIPQEVP